jgi:hypothetical protein
MISKKIGIMLDIESLDVGPRSVVTQLAFAAFDLEDPDTILREVEEYLPIQPQINLKRTINADTIIWWMQQDDASRERFKRSSGNDMDELIALVNSVGRKLTQVLEDATEYEIWARGPQFDCVNVQTLFNDCGQVSPWEYDKVMDLRTLMKQALLKTSDVPLPVGLVKHVALDDCKYQIVCYAEAIRKLRAAT